MEASQPSHQLPWRLCRAKDAICTTRQLGFGGDQCLFSGGGGSGARWSEDLCCRGNVCRSRRSVGARRRLASGGACESCSQPHFTHALRLLDSRNHHTKSFFLPMFRSTAASRRSLSLLQGDTMASCGVLLHWHLSTSFKQGCSTEPSCLGFRKDATSALAVALLWYRPFASKSIWPGRDRCQLQHFFRSTRRLAA